MTLTGKTFLNFHVPILTETIDWIVRQIENSNNEINDVHEEPTENISLMLDSIYENIGKCDINYLDWLCLQAEYGLNLFQSEFRTACASNHKSVNNSLNLVTNLDKTAINIFHNVKSDVLECNQIKTHKLSVTGIYIKLDFFSLFNVINEIRTVEREISQFQFICK